MLSLAVMLSLAAGCGSRGEAQSHPAAGLPATAPAARSTATSDVDQMRADVHYLASDELEGRGVETDGIHRAADYIAKDFKSSGLKPLPGVKGYFQPFAINLNAEIGDETALTVGDETCALREDFTPMGVSGEGSFAGAVAFVGYAISSHEHNYDDFAGVDVKGKVALALRYEPSDEKGDSRFDPNGRSDHATFTSKARAAAEHGAAALLIVNPPSEDDGEPERLLSMGRSAGARAEIPVLQVTRATADQILRAGGAKDLKMLQQKIDRSGKPTSFLLEGVRASGRVELERQQREVKNVVAYVPGKGPRKDEYVVIGAHYDHLGRGESGSMSRLNRNEIHNGADDNASGTAALLELAERVAADPRGRSVVFAAFAGEERGLLGSSHFVENSPIPLEKVVAMINLDMVGRLQNDTLQVGGTGTAAAFDAIVAEVDGMSPLKFNTASSSVGGRGGLGPSDHASFARKKIPVLFLWTGNHIDYHRPTDDAEKVNYDGMLQVVDVAEALVERIAEMPPAQYVDKFDSSMSASGRMRVRLGIMPDYAYEEPGVKVGSTMPNTPAATAGMKDGDVIVQIGEQKIISMTDYMTALNKHKPGDTVKIGVLRNGERLDLETKLTAGGRRG